MSFQMQEQQLDQWCWAAVTASLANFVQLIPAPSQCQLATNTLGVAGGCCPPASSACDQGASLQDVLTRQTILKKPAILRHLTFLEVRQLIDADWAIPVRIVWDGAAGNAHFVVVSGYTQSAVPQVQVDDPFYGRSIVDYDEFVSSYRQAGFWERTYPVWDRS